MVNQDDSLKEVGRTVAAQLRELAANWKLRAHMMEYVTRRPQCSMAEVARELSCDLNVSESSIRRGLPELFGDRRPWSPPGEDAELLEAPIVCACCKFTTATHRHHIEALFAMRRPKGGSRPRRQSYCRWCRKKAADTRRLYCDEGRVSPVTRKRWSEDGMLFDKFGRPLRAHEEQHAHKPKPAHKPDEVPHD